jgi:hypothetical protein
MAKITCQKLKIMVLLTSFIPGIKLENGIEMNE